MAKVQRLQAVDYLFMIGLPLLFLLVVAFGMRAIIGPIPQPSAVQRIKDGEIKPGMTWSQVRKRIGDPKEITQNLDGTATLTYLRTTLDGELSVEEGIVVIGPANTVVSTRVERQRPDPQPTSPGSL
jgi:hypothetical protein